MVIIMIGMSNQYSMSNTDTNVRSIYPHQVRTTGVNISETNTQPEPPISIPNLFATIWYAQAYTAGGVKVFFDDDE